ncbi:hypothetical protein Hanom_Chr06g00560181 [Helianthus anomalus]
MQLYYDFVLFLKMRFLKITEYAMYTKTVGYRYKEFNNIELVLKLARFKEDRKDRKINEYDLVFLPIIWHTFLYCLLQYKTQ